MSNLINQQGDVYLFQTDDDGEINVSDGLVEMRGGLETAAYISLFGGNEEDDGRRDNALTYWGNLDENEPEKKYISRTGYLLQSIPAIPANLLRIEDAARADLDWFVTAGVASSVEVSATMPGLNRVKITVNINAEGDPSKFEFFENWSASK